MSDPAPFYPIIYVRGYAMTESDIDETTADPFCGFNLGSTVYRATPGAAKVAKKFVFESPVVRLGTDFGYKDVYEHGLDIMDPGWATPIPSRSIVIYRYYDQASTLLGDGHTPPMEDFARGLSDLILRVKQFACMPGGQMSKDQFKCYLVAHSMGGLVCRAFLQNPKLGSADARKAVAKFFTYATPHNGIDMAGINVPGWLTKNDIANFNHSRMADYLAIQPYYKQYDRVDLLQQDVFPSQNVFCMIGTNRADYQVAAGLSRTFAGNGSDGLVRIENASLTGIDPKTRALTQCAYAFTYRSHSGYFGIVNGIESYQNLIRFLFGDVRIDIWLDIDDVTLPPDVERESHVNAGGKVDALYQFEVLVSTRGMTGYLTRRIAEEDSVACRSHTELKDPAQADRRHILLSTVFLGTKWKVPSDDPSLAYTLYIGARVPDYYVGGAIFTKQHFEGSYLYEGNWVLRLTPPDGKGGDWKVEDQWIGNGPAAQPSPSGESLTDEEILKALTDMEYQKTPDGGREYRLPFAQETKPGIRGTVRLKVTPWNETAPKPHDDPATLTETVPA